MGAVTAAMRTQVTQLYIGLFGRAPDADGLGYWTAEMAGGASLTKIAGEMYAVPAARSYYPLFLTNAEIVQSFYTNVLGRSDATGQAYWEGRLNAGDSVGKVMGDLVTAVANYSGTDASALVSMNTFNNKVIVGEYFAETLRSNNTTVAASVLTNVTDTAASVTAAKASADSGVSAAAGTTFALTTAAEAPTLTSHDDTITGLLGTLNATDVIDGLGGTDTMTVRVGDVGAVGAPQVTNVEIINLIEMGSATVSFANMQGYTAVNVWGGGNSAQLTNMTAVKVGVMSGWGGDLNIGYVDETTSNDTITLAINNASAFNLLESDNGFEAINFAGEGSGVDITIGGGSGLSSITITGTANVILALDRDSAVSGLNVNATALQANLTLTLGSQIQSSLLSAGELSFKSGTGADVFFIAGSAAGRMATSLALDGGAGTDILRLNVNSQNTLLPDNTAIETLQLVTLAGGDCASVTFSAAANHFSTFEIWGAALSAGMLHMSANPTIKVESGFAGKLTVSLETANGTADTINLTLDNVGSAGSAFMLVESAAAASIEVINVNVTGSGLTGGSGQYWGVGSAQVHITGTVPVRVGLGFSGGAGTGQAIVNATAVQGNVGIFYDNPDKSIFDVRISTGTGNDTIDLGSAMFGGVNSVTAIVDGGQGTDTLSFVVQSGQSAAPYGNSIETVSLTFISGSEGGAANVGFVSGLNNLVVSFGSAGTANSVTNIAAGLTSVTLQNLSSVSTGSTALSLNFISGVAATINMRGTDTAAHFGHIGIASASVVTINFVGSAHGSISIGTAGGDGFAIDQATALTLNANSTADVTIGTLCANNVKAFALNSTAGADVLFTAGIQLHSATQATITVEGNHSATLDAFSARLADLTLMASASGTDSAGISFSTAVVMGGDLSITTDGGDVTMFTISMNDCGASSQTAMSITLNARGTGDVITIAHGIDFSAADSATTIGFVISGSGNVNLIGLGGSGLNFGADSAETAFVINASNLNGQLVFDMSADSAITGSVGVNITLGGGVGTGNTSYAFSVGTGIVGSAIGNIVMLGTAASAADTVQGGAGGDYIAGSNGADTLGGGGGNDVIIGGAGSDTMSGGAGSDNFRFLSSAVGAVAAFDVTSGLSDVILDFGSGDTISFSSVTALTSIAGFTAVGSFAVYTASLTGTTALGANGWSAASGGVAIYQESGNTIIQVVLNTGGAGNSIGSGVVTITLVGITGFTSLTSVFNISINTTYSALTITHV